MDLGDNHPWDALAAVIIAVMVLGYGVGWLLERLDQDHRRSRRSLTTARWRVPRSCRRIGRRAVWEKAHE